MGLETEIKSGNGRASLSPAASSETSEAQAAAPIGAAAPARRPLRPQDHRRLELALLTVTALGVLGVLVALTPASVPVVIAAGFLMVAAALMIERFGAGARAISAAELSAAAEDHQPLAGTEQRFAELARALLDELPDAIVLADEEGRMIAANKNARAHFVGEGFLRKYLTTAIRRPTILEAVQRVREHGVAELIEFSDLVPVERHYTAYVARIAPDPPRPAAVLLAVRDITAGKILEQMRADFVANASHELRTPLSSLSGFIETLRNHARDDATAREKFLQIMHEQAQRMRRLIDDLLSLSRIELNEHVPPSDEIELKGVVGDVVAGLQPMAQAMKTHLEVKLAPGLAPVVGTRDELVQVLQNLVDNAIKYGRAEQPVEIHVGAGAPAGVLPLAVETNFVSVIDHGEGVAREHIPRLTERFYRVDVKRSRERGGTGLGLAIVKHIVSRHRGKLHIKSEVGQGSVFTVLLPIAPGGRPAVRASEGDPAPNDQDLHLP